MTIKVGRCSPFASFFLLLAGNVLECNGALQKVATSWTSPIVYDMNTAGLAAATQTLITKVLTDITTNVPGLTFTSTPNVNTPPYIYFDIDTTRTTFCEDENIVIGMQTATATTISITESLNCATQGWILHFVMHALGFYHEHQRSDRSGYIYVNTANSLLSSAAQTVLFGIQSSAVIVNSAGYDWESVTHYDYQATNNNGKQTIVALPAEYYSVKSYGHATASAYTANSVLSTADVTALRTMFPGATPAQTSQVCYNGGTWYNWCLCKPGYAGQYCNEIFCYNTCQNSGYCAINSTTGLPGCVCPSGYSGTYCEISGTSGNCSSSGSCPFWSSCTTSSSTCNCDPYPFYGPTCSIAIITVPTTSTTSTTTASGGSASSSSTSSTTTITSPVCTAANVGAPRSITFAPNAVYLRLSLSDIPYISDYSNLGSSNSVALQNFLAGALQGDYQTQSSGQFISILIQNIQPPLSGSTSGCTVVDFLAKFTSNLTPLQRTHIVQATYAKATSSNLPSLFGILGSNNNQATRVSTVLYITPLNSAISPASPCVVYSSEGACQNGGTCSASGTEPMCTCMGGFTGIYCSVAPNSNVTLAWPIWQIVVVSIAAAIALLLIILLITYFVRQSQNNSWQNYMWNSPDRYFDYDMRARQMQMAPTYMVPAEPPSIHPSYYPQNGGYGPSSGAMPPPYGNGNTLQRPKHYQYPYNIQ